MVGAHLRRVGRRTGSEFERLGLAEVEVRAIDAPTVFRDFGD